MSSLRLVSGVGNLWIQLFRQHKRQGNVQKLEKSCCGSSSKTLFLTDKWWTCMNNRSETYYTCDNSSGKRNAWETILVLVTLVLLCPQLSAGGRDICLPQDAPVLELLQTTLLKQLQVEYMPIWPTPHVRTWIAYNWAKFKMLFSRLKPIINRSTRPSSR